MHKRTSSSWSRSRWRLRASAVPIVAGALVLGRVQYVPHCHRRLGGMPSSSQLESPKSGQTLPKGLPGRELGRVGLRRLQSRNQFPISQWHDGGAKARTPGRKKDGANKPKGGRGGGAPQGAEIGWEFLPPPSPVDNGGLGETGFPR